MIREKSKIIKQIQSYHHQLATLYYDLFEKSKSEELKLILHDLYKHEIDREEYLEKHKKVAEAMNCWLSFPCDKLSDQISECFEEIHTGPNLSITDLIKIKMHFDDCLITIYNILASENELSETVANIFYYMLKKTKEEEEILAKMLHNSKNTFQYNFMTEQA